jgi:hypothetical protein
MQHDGPLYSTAGHYFFCRHANYMLGKVPLTYSATYQQFSITFKNAIGQIVPPPPCIDPKKNQFSAVAATLHTSWSYIIGHSF